MSSMKFRQFAINPIGKGPVRIIHLNNLVSLLLNDNLYRVWYKLALYFSLEENC